jgi:hypothetical protein
MTHPLPSEIDVLVRSLVSADFRDYDHFILREKILEKEYRKLGHVYPFMLAYDVSDHILAFSAKPGFHKFFGSSPVQNPKTLILALQAATSLEQAGYTEAKTLAREVATKLTEAHLFADEEGGCYLRTPFMHWYSSNHGVPLCMTAQDPSIYLTSLCGTALLRYSELDHSFLKYAVRIGDYLKNPKSRVEIRNRPFFKYFIGRDNLLVHNVNTLAGSFLLRLATKVGDDGLHQIGMDALLNSISEIAEDGSLSYSSRVDPTYRAKRIDNFHTGFVICDLLDASEVSPEVPFMRYAVKMLGFYMRMFDRSGTPSYTPWRRFPKDIHDYAVGIITFSRLSDFYPDYLRVAELIRSSAARTMRDSDGLYWFQRYPLVVHRGKFLRWNQAWMLRAISDCVLRQEEEGIVPQENGVFRKASSYRPGDPAEGH